MSDVTEVPGLDVNRVQHLADTIRASIERGEYWGARILFARHGRL
jgi:hypothetical protein